MDTYARAIRAHEKMTCLLPGCCFCTNYIKDEIDAAIAEALDAERAQRSPNDVSEGVNTKSQEGA